MSKKIKDAIRGTAADGVLLPISDGSDTPKNLSLHDVKEYVMEEAREEINEQGRKLDTYKEETDEKLAGQDEKLSELEKKLPNKTISLKSGINAGTYTFYEGAVIESGVYKITVSADKPFSTTQLGITFKNSDKESGYDWRNLTVIGTGSEPKTYYDGSPITVYAELPNDCNTELISVFLGPCDTEDAELSIKIDYIGHSQKSTYNNTNDSLVVPVRTYIGKYVNAKGVLVDTTPDRTVFEFEESVVVRYALTGGGASRVVAYYDKDDVCIKTDYVGDGKVACNVVADINSVPNCAKIRVTVVNSVGYRIEPFDYNNENLLYKYVEQAAFFDVNGNITYIDRVLCTSLIKVAQGDIYSYYGAGGASKPFALYDVDKTFVKVFGENGSDFKWQKLVIPFDGYLRVQSRCTTGGFAQDGELYKIEKNDELKPVTVTWDATGYYINDKGVKTPATSLKDLRVSNAILINHTCDAYHLYTACATPASGYGIVFFYDKDTNFISLIKLDADKVASNPAYKADCIILNEDIPAKAVYMKIVGRYDDSLEAANTRQCPTYPTELYEVGRDWKSGYEETDAYGKSVAVFGGSFSVYPSTNAAKNLWKLKLGMTVTDFGVGGNGYSNLQDANNNVQRQVDRAIASGIKYNYYVLWLSTNDYTNNREIGDWKSYSVFDEYNEDALKTQCGGINYAVRTILAFHPSAKILMFSALPAFANESTNVNYSDTTNSIGYRFKDYVDAALRCAAVKHIPVLDHSMLMGVNSHNFSRFYFGDNLHPNIDGYRRIADGQIDFFVDNRQNAFIDNDEREIVHIDYMNVPADGSLWVKNSLYFNSGTKLLRKYTYKGLWYTVAFSKDAIYEYNNILYKWDFEEKKFVPIKNEEIVQLKAEVAGVNKQVFGDSNVYETTTVANGFIYIPYNIIAGKKYNIEISKKEKTPIVVLNTSISQTPGSRVDKDIVTIPSGIVASKITFAATGDASYISIWSNGVTVIDVTVISDTLRSEVDNLQSKWKDKTILWLGTSIPEGGYPMIVGDLLGARIINKSKGSSVISAYKRDGSILSGDNGHFSLSQTKAEKDSLYGEGYGQYSFEERLLPYLDGTNPFPDLIVLEYGSDYNLEQNKTEMSKINEDASGAIGTDSVTVDLGVNFNRCTYTGAMLFIINTIYKYNPMARIVICGYQNKMRRKEQVDAQYTVADYWQIPMCDTSKLLGWSDRVVAGSKDKFNEKYSPAYTATADVTQFRMWCPDDWHPHTNKTIVDGYLESNYEIARKVASFLKSFL